MAAVIATPLGAAIPQHLPHAISVSLPTWQDNVDYEEGRPRVVDAMVNGYPRLFINKIIQRVSSLTCLRTMQVREWLLTDQIQIYTTARTIV